MTVAKALRVSFAKVADKLLDLALAVIGVTRERCDGDQLPDKIDEAGLLLLLDGPGGATGGAVLGAGLVTALVQQQITGRVHPAPATPAERRMTATDAALCAPVLEALFERAHGMLETPKDKGVLNRYSFGARCENARLFNLALGAHEYHLIHMTVDLAGGAVQSTMTLILPEPAEEEQPDEAGSGGYVPREARTLGETLLCVPAELSAVLCQVRMSLSQMNALKPGKTIPVPSEAFENVSLVSLDGRRVARGVMG